MLWEFLTEAAKEDMTIPQQLTVKDIMDTWTLQMGFPLITAIRYTVKDIMDTWTLQMGFTLITAIRWILNGSNGCLRFIRIVSDLPVA